LRHSEADIGSPNLIHIVHDDIGEVVFCLPFSEIVRSPLPRFYATYKIVGHSDSWLIFHDDELVGGFAQRSMAESYVLKIVEARCAKEEASQVLIEDEVGCEEYVCRCFEEAPPGTLLS
jgi:hypothetical protein